MARKRRGRRRGADKAAPVDAEQGDLLAPVDGGAVVPSEDAPEPDESRASSVPGANTDAVPEREPEAEQGRDVGQPAEPAPGPDEGGKAPESGKELAGDPPPGLEAGKAPEVAKEPEARADRAEEGGDAVREPDAEKAPGAGPPRGSETLPPAAATTDPARPSIERVTREERRPVVFELVAEESREPDRPPPAGERLARAKELVQDGRIDEALALYRAVLADNPGSLKARNNLGALFEALGQHELALEQFEAAVKLEPENVDVLNNLGAVLGALGRYDEGESLLRRGARLAPDNVGVRTSLGILFFRKGLYGQAEAELRWACEQDEENGPAFFYRGEALNRLGRYDEAMKTLERAIVLQPTNGKAFYTLGILYDRKHLPEEASHMYRKAREYLVAR